MSAARENPSAGSAPSASTQAAPGSTPEVTIVMPVQDLDAEVEQVVQALGGELERLGHSWEAILVYDGIQGEPWRLGLALQASSQQQVRTIALHKAFGESVCLSSAFEHARGQVILTTPQYVQVDPRDLKGLFDALDEGADLVVSWRHPRVDSWASRMQSAAFNWVLRLLVGAQLHDLNCTLRLIRRDVLEQLTVYGNMYRYLPAIAHSQGFRVREVRVRHLQERGSSGLLSPGIYARRLLDILAVTFLTKFTHKPLRFFGTFGGLAVIVGSLLAGIQVLEWAVREEVTGLYQQPLFLLGVLLFVLGVQIVGFGLVGEIIIYTQARNVREYRIERIDD
ncbi:MAG: glycosyltransferase [Planctomycetota bacterium]